MINALAALILGLVPALPDAVDEGDAGTDSACGPRCVRWLLSFYKHPSEDLISLVTETQGAASRQSTFEMLRNALSRRGVACRFVELGQLSLLEWPHPVIVHIDGGHFAIAQCLSKTSVLVWMGLPGHQVMAPWQLRLRMSPVVLLTSPQLIPENVRCDTSWPRWAGLSLSVCAGLSSLCLIRRRWRRQAAVTE